MIKIYNPDNLESLSQDTSDLASNDWMHGALASNESSNAEDLRIKLDTLTARILYLETKIRELEE